MNMTLSNNARQLPCPLWSERWPSIPNSVDDKSLPVHECGMYRSLYDCPRIRKANAGIGCSASQRFPKGDPVGCDYGMLVCKNIGKFSAVKIYGKGIVAKSGGEFRRTPIQL